MKSQQGGECVTLCPNLNTRWSFRCATRARMRTHTLTYTRMHAHTHTESEPGCLPTCGEKLCHACPCSGKSQLNVPDHEPIRDALTMTMCPNTNTNPNCTHRLTCHFSEDCNYECNFLIMKDFDEK